jgi:hypothetical protein
MMKEFEFTLKDGEVTYSEGGVAARATKLLLKAPTPKQAKQADKLRQSIMRALSDLNKNNQSSNKKTSDDDSKIDGEAVILMLSMSTSVDMFDIRECFLSLLLSGSCLVIGTKPITQFNLDNEISYEEQTQIMGEYIANFLISLPQIGKKK